MRHARYLSPALALLLALGACSESTQSPTALNTPSFSKKPTGGGGGGGGGGGRTSYSYALTGDIEFAAGGAAPTASMSNGQPFAKLHLAGVSITLQGPTGDIAACQAATPKLQYATDINAPNQPWTGTLKIASTGVLDFSGLDSQGNTVEFAVEDFTGGPQQTSLGGGAYSDTYSDASLYYGSNANLDGLYRCVNVTLTATP